MRGDSESRQPPSARTGRMRDDTPALPAQARPVQSPPHAVRLVREAAHRCAIPQALGNLSEEAEGRQEVRLLILAALVLASCAPRPTTEYEQDAVVKSLRYIRDENRMICFATITSPTYAGYSVTSIATVPCEKIPPGGSR